MPRPGRNPGPDQRIRRRESLLLQLSAPGGGTAIWDTVLRFRRSLRRGYEEALPVKRAGPNQTGEQQA
ncbi:hypothetical protein JI59_18260 [Novosphingobium pentaromativorans US6-1]|nr:hypothetical protein JI59_18260 [Novosphingobium pentaromativorans US6-1]